MQVRNRVGFHHDPFRLELTTLTSALIRHDTGYRFSKAGPSLDECRSQTGINGVAAPNAASTTVNQHALSEYACRQIHKYIIVPITREEKLKDFHPLVNGIPYRVARKEITCLRDLEKVLLWLAPVRLIPSLESWVFVRDLILARRNGRFQSHHFSTFAKLRSSASIQLSNT